MAMDKSCSRVGLFVVSRAEIRERILRDFHLVTSVLLTIKRHHSNLIGAVARGEIPRTTGTRLLLPETVIVGGVEVARDLDDIQGQAALLVLGVEGQSRLVAWARLPDPIIDASEAELAAGPFSDTEVARLAVVIGHLDVCPTKGVVEPLLLVAVGYSQAVDVQNVDGIPRVDIVPRRAGLVLAELEFARHLCSCHRSIPPSWRGTIVPEKVAVFHPELVAFS